MRARVTTLITAVLPLLAMGPIATPAIAQDTGGAAREAAEIPDSALESFAEAYLDLAQVRQSMQQEMAQAGSQEEQATIRQEANQEMASILRDHGLSPQRYREITQTLNADSAQRAEFQQLVQELQGGSGGGGG